MMKKLSVRPLSLRFFAALLALFALLCAVPAARAEQTPSGQGETPAPDGVALSPEDAPAATADGTVANLTAGAGFAFSAKASQGAETRLLDAEPMTRVRFSPEDTMTVALPEGAAWVRLDWYEAPTAAIVAQLDAAGAALREESVADGLLQRYIRLEDGAASLVLTAGRALSLSDVYVYGPGDAPERFGYMGALPETCDLLLVCAHTGDEQLRFTGLVPLYAGEQGLKVCVVFLSHENRCAQEQALEGLRLCGLEAQPVFCGLPYKFMPDRMRASYHWKQNVMLAALVPLLRQCRPTVVVTHDPAGEAGDTMHAYTAETVLAAVDAAADSGAKGYNASEKLYGAWQVKKVYFHSEAGGTAAPDVSAPLSAFAGESAAALSARAYGLYSGLSMYHNEAGVPQSYGLAYTAVGEDEATDDLFSHLDPACLTNPLRKSEAARAAEAAAEAAAATPTPAPTPEATSMPAPTATPALTALQAAAPRFPFTRVLIPVGAGAVLLALVLLLWRQRKKDGSASKVLLLCVFLIAAGVLIASLVVIIGWRRAEETATAQLVEAGAQATPEATPAPAAETPEAVPSPAPTATPHPWAQYFRAEGEPDEVIVSDPEKGYYEYRSDTLSVIIDTREGMENETRKFTYYVAHIRTLADSLRTGFGSFREDGKDKTECVTIARRYRAVLAITGDDMIEREADLKGIIMRNGKVYNKKKGESLLAVYPDMSMRVFLRNKVTAEQLLDDGVEDTYSFGPTLVLDGQVYENAGRNRVSSPNPRVALGMVEPGHYVAIVVDGRLPGYSAGISTARLAELFVEENCVVAHNMDGGASSALIFMGEYVNKRSEEHTRIVPDMIMWGYSERIPTVDDPLENDGVVKVD